MCRTIIYSVFIWCPGCDNTTNMMKLKNFFFFRYFADGCSFKSLSFYFMRGTSTIQKLVDETCKILWECLQPEFMPTPTTEKWIEVAQRFYTLWNLPRCVGSLDGKHIRIRAPG